MADTTIIASHEVVQAFRQYDKKATFNNLQVACYIGISLMPLGVVLDYFVYPAQVPFFLSLRLICSGLIALFLGIVRTPFGQRNYRLLGVTLSMFPTFFMSWMVFRTEGATSPYYAGLNVVLLVIGFVLNWGFIESFSAISLVMLMYITACVLHGPITAIAFPTFFNNLYFLVLTGIVVVTGSHFHAKLRLNEFALRFELDKSRHQLEENHQKLLELDQAKSRFFANISHELRTPLTLLLAPLETLLQRFSRSFDDETKSLLVTMHSNGMRLLKLINDLLDLVRLESGRMEARREPVAIADALKGLASAVRQVAQDKRIQLRTDVAPALGPVLADRDKLEKILLNLVFNALKFTPAGGSVELGAAREGEELVLTVKDTGMGISEQNLPHVFSRFWQADDSSRRKYQGVGIGLALVKELAEVQGGKVSVASREGKGTTFTVRLPYLEPEPVAPQAESARPALTAPAGGGHPGAVTSEEWLSNLYRRAELFPALTPLQDSLRPVESVRGNSNAAKILIADDEPDMLRFLKSHLSPHYQVLEAVDGQQAIEKACQFLPDIILLDMMMPEKDGLQACKELRERTLTQSIPVILLTARADEETKLAALSAGASDFLPKPFSTTELHVRIKNLVESYHNQRALAKQNQILEKTIEQLKDTETQLVQTEKLASLGRMSAGIIHEINNPLNFATTGLYTLKNKAKYLDPGQQQEYAEILRDVEDGLKRVKTIVSDLRSFSHHENGLIEQVDVAEVATAALRFLSHEWRSKVQIHQRLAENQTIWGNKNKLIQVLVNLLQNALDALQHKTFPEGTEPTIWVEGRVEHGKSLLVVRDNGEGIDPECLDKIFDPFFTTKEVGQGMGLGLSICYRIVQEYEGRIAVRSERGQFCEFTMEFPVKG